jgi:MFS family permease
LTPPPAVDAEARTTTSAWSPLRIGAFRMLWLAQLGTLIGTWMQTVGAQWLLIDEPNAPTLVSLVQTASLLPMLLLALPAGVLADSFDRRRLLIVVQLGTVAVGVVLTAVSSFGGISPAALLLLTFLLGCGQAMSMPAWQALIPDIVPTAQVREASALGAVSMNLARAVGPAFAGLLITEVAVGAVFALNTFFYAAMALALLRWGPDRASEEAPERFVAADPKSPRDPAHAAGLRVTE